MTESKTLQKVVYSGIEFDVDRESKQAWVHDLKLSEMLRYARPRAIRDLIKVLLRDGFLNEINVRRVLRQTSERGGRPTTEYYLDEFAAVMVAIKSGTQKAGEIASLVAKTFIAVVKGEFVHKSQLEAERRMKELETNFRLELADARAQSRIRKETLSAFREALRAVSASSGPVNTVDTLANDAQAKVEFENARKLVAGDIGLSLAKVNATLIKKHKLLSTFKDNSIAKVKMLTASMRHAVYEKDLELKKELMLELGFNTEARTTHAPVSLFDMN